MLWNLSGEASRPGSVFSGGVWRLMLNLPLLFLLAAQLGQRSRFALGTTAVTIAGFWTVFYSTAAILVGNLFQYGIDRLPWDRVGEGSAPSWGTDRHGRGLFIQPLGLILLGSSSKQGFSELTRATLLAFGIGLFSVLTAGLLMALLLNPSSWVLAGILFMFGGGWIVLGLTFIGESQPRQSLA